MKICIDRNIYSDKCLSNVVYWSSGEYRIYRSLIGTTEMVSVENVTDEEAFRTRFFQKLNDCKLREIIESETKDIKTILYAKAFGEFDEITEEEIKE